VDSRWVEAGTRRVAYYNHVYPGRYRFRVLACNNDGVWNEQGSTLSLLLQPHFWQSWWFRLTLPLAGGGLVGGTVNWLARRKGLRKLERLKHQHELERERARIARDIHDDLGSSLTRIAMLSELAEADKGSPGQVETHVRKIAASARETVQSLDEIVWAVSPENDTWNSLVEYISQYASEFFENTSIRCRLDLPLDLPDYPLPSEARHGLFLVLKEALNNVLKHARASQVRIQVAQRASVLEIIVADDGRGFEPERVVAGSNGNGLKNMRQRIAALRGSFDLQSAPGKGTRLTVSFTLLAGLVQEGGPA
jgi:signal transduction histidine kinase